MHATPILPTAVEMRERLELLYLERATAGVERMTANSLYMADLEDEIATTRNAYVGAAVTEIATLRGVLSGPLYG